MHISQGALPIGGNSVFDTVRHPSVRRIEFLRPAVHDNEKEAFAGAQAYLYKRPGKGGAAGSAEDE